MGGGKTTKVILKMLACIIRLENVEFVEKTRTRHSLFIHVTVTNVKP